MHQNDHFIVMSSQTLLHVSVYERHHKGAHELPDDEVVTPKQVAAFD
jgi:hypothetical protein